MFGLLQKMDRYSNKLMTEEEKIDFVQEIVDNGLVWDMHQKYQNAALNLIGLGKVNSRLPLGAFDNFVESRFGEPDFAGMEAAQPPYNL